MKLAYVIIGLLMTAVGLFASYDLITNSGFNEIETPKQGNFGVLGPALLFTGLVFAKFQGSKFQNRGLGIGVVAGVVFQTLGTLPYVQPRLLSRTAGHAGVGLNEIISGLLILGGTGGAVLALVCLLVARAESP